MLHYQWRQTPVDISTRGWPPCPLHRFVEKLPFAISQFTILSWNCCGVKVRLRFASSAGVRAKSALNTNLALAGWKRFEVPFFLHFAGLLRRTVFSALKESSQRRKLCVDASNWTQGLYTALGLHLLWTLWLHSPHAHAHWCVWAAQLRKGSLSLSPLPCLNGFIPVLLGVATVPSSNSSAIYF